MGATSYIGISSKARKVKKMYIGIGGKAREIKKAWIGVGGKARLIYNSGPDDWATSNNIITQYGKSTDGGASWTLGNFASFGRCNYQNGYYTKAGITIIDYENGNYSWRFNGTYATWSSPTPTSFYQYSEYISDGSGGKEFLFSEEPYTTDLNGNLYVMYMASSDYNSSTRYYGVRYFKVTAPNTVAKGSWGYLPRGSNSANQASGPYYVNGYYYAFTGNNNQYLFYSTSIGGAWTLLKEFTHGFYANHGVVGLPALEELPVIEWNGSNASTQRLYSVSEKTVTDKGSAFASGMYAGSGVGATFNTLLYKFKGLYIQFCNTSSTGSNYQTKAYYSPNGSSWTLISTDVMMNYASNMTMNANAIIHGGRSTSYGLMRSTDGKSFSSISGTTNQYQYNIYAGYYLTTMANGGYTRHK